MLVGSLILPSIGFFVHKEEILMMAQVEVKEPGQIEFLSTRQHALMGCVRAQ